MAIRIMHVIPSTHNVGGLESGVLNLVHQLDGFEHTVCPVGDLGPMGDLLTRDKVRVLRVEKSGRRLSLQVGALARHIRETKPDIVHSRNWGALEAVIAGRWVRSCTLIHSEHGVETNPAMDPWRRVVSRRLAFELADRVFCVSQQLREVMARRTGFALRKIGVIHNGVDMQRFAPDAPLRARARQHLGIEDGQLCIGCVGRLYPIKDYWTLLRALELVSASYDNWRCVIVGQGPDLGSLREFVNDRATLVNRVNFLGVTREVPEILNAMDVYVLPSISEGISNSLLEAMATGLPVLACATGGNPEVVVDGEAGLLFPVGDFHRLAEQLLQLQQSGTLRSRLGEQARQRVEEHFSMQHMVGQYRHMYSSLARGKAA